MSPTTATDFKGNMLLCDAAHVAGDKLYILGGGWGRAIKIGPITMVLALRWETPWHETNLKHKLKVQLMSNDGKVVTPLNAPIDPATAKPAPLVIELEFEVGRPPGMPAGSPVISLLAPGVAVDLQAANGYRWEMLIDGKILDTASFDVVDPPPGLVIPQQPSAPAS